MSDFDKFLERFKKTWKLGPIFGNTAEELKLKKEYEEKLAREKPNE